METDPYARAPICQFCGSRLGQGEWCAVCALAWEIQTTVCVLELREAGYEVRDC